MRRSGAPSQLAKKVHAPGKENIVAKSTISSAADTNVPLQKPKSIRQKFKSPVAERPSLKPDNLSANLSSSTPPHSREFGLHRDLNVHKDSVLAGRKASQVIELIQVGRVRPVAVLDKGGNFQLQSATVSSTDLNCLPISAVKEIEAGKDDSAASPGSKLDDSSKDFSRPEGSLTFGLKRNFPGDDELQIVSSDVRKKHHPNRREGAPANYALEEAEQAGALSIEGNLSEADALVLDNATGLDLDTKSATKISTSVAELLQGCIATERQCIPEEAPITSKVTKSTTPLHFPQRHVSSLHGNNLRDTKGHGQQELPSEYYSVMYCLQKKNAKRKGPWSDGVIVCQGRSCTLQDLNGRNVSKGSVQGLKDMPEGASVEIGKFEVEIMRKASKEETLSGALYLGDIAPRSVVAQPVTQVNKKRHFTSFNVVGSHRPRDKGPTLPHPDTWTLNGGSAAEVPVVVDTHVASKLRPHQREGVKFMYECVMGLRSKSFCGCLLADEMGLGKTLQVISLIWTLVKQGPTGFPAVKRVLVVCPSSLVQNWGNEVQKWLGRERLRFMAVHAGTANKEAAQQFSDFKAGAICPLLITSYELLRKHMDKIASAKPGLLVCDEAHRLKNCAGNKTIDALLGLQCPRKILLTGTPVQNDLNEFYAMIDFANPGLLGPLSAFKRIFAEPIELSQDRNASEEEQKMGLARSLELQTRTGFCILRRTADINKAYLPTKQELIVFCRLQPLQIAIYKIIAYKALRSLYMSDNTSATILSSIISLRKLCNHPQLIRNDSVNETNLEPVSKSVTDAAALDSKSDYADIDRLFQESVDQAEERWTFSGKLSCLYQLLRAIHAGSSAGPRDRVVVVSNFTRTLDIIQNLCTSQGWQWLRLDGSTEVSARQSLVDQLNSGYGEVFVFLLSSKAGGTGLNLIGANRLVLFDPDWNPATDAQAIARVWREGQLKPVIIYRLLSTGSIEEKIFQRQIMKGGMAASLEAHVDGQNKKGSGGRHFTKEELRELFTLNLETECDTFDLISRTNTEGAKSWTDHSQETDDAALQNALQSGVVSFVYHNMGKEVISAPANLPSPVDDGPEAT